MASGDVEGREGRREGKEGHRGGLEGRTGRGSGLKHRVTSRRLGADLTTQNQGGGKGGRLNKTCAYVTVLVSSSRYPFVSWCGVRRRARDDSGCEEAVTSWKHHLSSPPSVSTTGNSGNAGVVSRPWVSPPSARLGHQPRAAPRFPPRDRQCTDVRL